LRASLSAIARASLMLSIAPMRTRPSATDCAERLASFGVTGRLPTRIVF
jgi:hypothetical protein